jgi:diguanylate cyclase (GGDEF)-like protein
MTTVPGALPRRRRLRAGAAVPWTRESHRRIVVGAAALSAAGALAYLVMTLTGTAATGGIDWTFDLAFTAAVAACVLRGALVEAQRGRWLLIGAALGCWIAADLYWELFLADLESPPYPSPADAGYLLFYPLLAAAVIVELRSPGRRQRVTIALDALAAVLIVAALAAAVLYPALRAATDGSARVVATNLSYPVGDILVIVLITIRVFVTGERPRGPWLWLIAGLLCFVAADVTYLDLVARDAYTPGGPLDSLWLIAPALFAAAAISRDRQPRARSPKKGRMSGLTPALFALVAAAVLTVDHFHRANEVTLLLSAATIVVVAGRLLVAFADNGRLLAARDRDLAARERDLRRDPLTGLPNRRGLSEALHRELAAAARRGSSTGVLMLDVDNFKYVNDTLGHEAGDRLIVAVGDALGTVMRDGDVLARLGGDEFAVLLVDSGEQGAVACAERLTAALRESRLLAAAPRGHVTASVGVAVVRPDESLAWEQALARADAAMYAAKEAGRDGFSLHADSASSQEVLAERFGWSARIRHALDTDGFTLFAQPVIDVATGNVHSHELLVRMRDPGGKLWMPGAFLPEASRFGLMTSIDRWVLERAVAFSATSDTPVAVNVSPASVDDADSREFIVGLVRDAQLPVDRLIIEVTEHAAVESLSTAHAFVCELKRLGCVLALDDFGVAFASFFHLKQLPFDLIKIDGSFIRNIASEPTDQVLVGAIVDVARRLGKRTVAEHVADDAALAVVAGLGVDLAQGFHLGRPEPIAGLQRAAA